MTQYLISFDDGGYGPSVTVPSVATTLASSWYFSPPLNTHTRRIRGRRRALTRGGAGVGCQDRRRLPLCSRGSRVRARPDRLIEDPPRPVHAHSSEQNNNTTAAGHANAARVRSGRQEGHRTRAAFIQPS